MDPKIIYEDDNFLAIDKPAGLVVHPARVSAKKLAAKKNAASREAADEKKEDEPALTDWLVKKYPQLKNVGDDPSLRPGIVHRLDKETSGVMIIPKTQEYFEYLKSLFKARAVKKTYYAIVFGVPKKKKGIIDAPIGIKNGTLKRSVRSKKMAKPAVTEYEVLKTMTLPQEPRRQEETPSRGRGKKTSDKVLFSLLKVMPLTGRTHQIRVHLASIGHPIAGDPLYGPKKQPAWVYLRAPSKILSGKILETAPAGKKNARTRLMLHARSLTFARAPGTSITLEADTPSYFSSIKN